MMDLIFKNPVLICDPHNQKYPTSFSLMLAIIVKERKSHLRQRTTLVTQFYINCQGQLCLSNLSLPKCVALFYLIAFTRALIRKTNKYLMRTLQVLDYG